MSEYYLGIDIGGTGIKSSLVDSVGRLVPPKRYIKTDINFNIKSNNILNQVISEVQELLRIHNDKTIRGIGIATAGVVDVINGIITYSGPTIPGYTGTKLKENIERSFNIPCKVMNDVNAAALGELWKNNISTNFPIFYLTVGTGIGGALIINNKNIPGFSNTAGEIGYLPISGHNWQDVASTNALVKFYIDNKIDSKIVNGYDVFEASDLGDDKARRAIDKFIDNFTEGLQAIVYTCNPEYVIIGGGISARGEKLTKEIELSLRNKIQSEIFMPRHIIPATQGNDASILGAIRQFID